AWEMGYFGSLSYDGSADPDADGLTNAQELAFGSDPEVIDTDGDGADDAAEHTAGSNPTVADTDLAGLPEGYELAHGLHPAVNDAFMDRDADRVPNLWECKRGTSRSGANDNPAADTVVAQQAGGTHPTTQAATNNATSNSTDPYH